MTKLIFRSINQNLWALSGMYNGQEVYVTGSNENECINQLLKLVNAA